MVFLAMHKVVVHGVCLDINFICHQNQNNQTNPIQLLQFSSFFPILNSHKMSYSIKTLLVLHLLVLLIVQTQSQSTDLISKICKKTPYYDLCLSSLQSSPQGSNSDISGLAHIMADLLLSNATDTLDYIHGLLKQSPEADMQKPLANCAELYIPIVKYTLPESIEALSNGHYGFANYGISDAAKEAQACEKGFSGSTKPPLTDRNTLVSSLSEVTVAIINLVQE